MIIKWLKSSSLVLGNQEDYIEDISFFKLPRMSIEQVKKCKNFSHISDEEAEYASGMVFELFTLAFELAQEQILKEKIK